MILRSFKSTFAAHEDVPKHFLLDPLIEQLLLNLKSHSTGENTLRAFEIEFLTSVVKDHVRVLREDTVLLLTEYF